MAEFTKEQLAKRCKSQIEAMEWMLDRCPGDVNANESLRVAEIALAALTAGMEQEPVAWPNHCDSAIPAALRFLAEKPRPIYGNSPYNTEHLYQLAREIEAMALRPLYAAPQLPQPAAVVSDEVIDTFEAEFRRAFEVSAGVEQLIEIGYQGEKFSLSIRDAATWWKLGRAAILKHSAPFIVTSDHRMMEMPKDEDIDTVAAMLQGAEPVQAVPEGWVPCSPEWIERNGPCSCAEAPRIAFGSIGNHYHPHIYHNPKHEERP